MQEVAALADRIVVIAEGRTVAEGTTERCIAECRREQSRGRVLPADRDATAQATRRHRDRVDGRTAMIATWWAVVRKELVDGLRDRRTILTMLFTGIAMGPIALC